jgi:hypothetical protein
MSTRRLQASEHDIQFDVGFGIGPRGGLLILLIRIRSHRPVEAHAFAHGNFYDMRSTSTTSQVK